MSESNFAITRLNNNNIQDDLTGQGFPFLKIYGVNSSQSSTFAQQNAANGIYQALMASPCDLAFMESGSLMSLEHSTPNNPSYFYASPFALVQVEIPTAQNVIGNNPATYSTIIGNSASPTTSGVGLQGTLYVSPLQGKYILQDLSDSSTNYYAYNVFYNPMNRSNLQDTTISDNLQQYCSIIGNVDPLCYCQNGTSQCAAQFLGTTVQSLQNKAPDAYTAAENNCAYFSPMCNAWATNGNTYVKNEILSSLQANRNGVTMCGTQFSYGKYGMSSSSGKTMTEACGIPGSLPTPGFPTPTPTPTPTTSKPVTAAADKAANSKKTMIIIVSILLFIGIVTIGIIL